MDELWVREPRLMVPGQNPIGGVKLNRQHPLFTCLPKSYALVEAYASNGMLVDGVTGGLIGPARLTGSTNYTYTIPTPKYPDSYGGAVTTFYHAKINATDVDYSRYIRISGNNGNSRQGVSCADFGAGQAHIVAGYATTSSVIAAADTGKPIWNIGWLTIATRGVNGDVRSETNRLAVKSWANNSFIYDKTESPSAGIFWYGLNELYFGSVGISLDVAFVYCYLGVVPDPIFNEMLKDPFATLVPA